MIQCCIVEVLGEEEGETQMEMTMAKLRDDQVGKWTRKRFYNDKVKHTYTVMVTQRFSYTILTTVVRTSVRMVDQSAENMSCVFYLGISL